MSSDELLLTERDAENFNIDNLEDAIWFKDSFGVTDLYDRLYDYDRDDLIRLIMEGMDNHEAVREAQERRDYRHRWRGADRGITSG